MYPGLASLHYLEGQGFWKLYTELQYGYMNIRPWVTIPDAPNDWSAMIKYTLNIWNDSLPDLVFNKPMDLLQDYSTIKEFSNKLSYEFPAVTEHLAGLWAQQWFDLCTLRNLEDLDNRSYFFLLHLLIGLGSANSDKIWDYVARLTCTHTPTEELYPEETFINQLTYLALMYLGDVQEPGEKYGLDRAARTALFTELQNLTLSTRTGSDAIRRSLTRQLRTMHAVTDYPLLDPESHLSLSERKARTRNALLKTFKTVPLEVPEFADKDLWTSSRLPGQSATPEALSEERRAELEAMISNMIF